MDALASVRIRHRRVYYPYRGGIYYSRFLHFLCLLLWSSLKRMELANLRIPLLPYFRSWISIFDLNRAKSWYVQWIFISQAEAIILLFWLIGNRDFFSLSLLVACIEDYCFFEIENFIVIWLFCVCMCWENCYFRARAWRQHECNDRLDLFVRW